MLELENVGFRLKKWEPCLIYVGHQSVVANFFPEI